MSSEKNMENPSETETLRPQIEMPKQMNCKLINQKVNTEVSITRKQFLEANYFRMTKTLRTKDSHQRRSKELKYKKSFHGEGTQEKTFENGDLEEKVS